MPIETSSNVNADGMLKEYLRAKLAGAAILTHLVQPHASMKALLHEQCPLTHGGTRDCEAVGRAEIDGRKISAYELFSTAKRIGMEDELDYVMLWRSCEELMMRAKRLNRPSPTRFSWNVRASLFLQPDFVENFLTILEKTGFPADRVAIEILETEALNMTAETNVRIQALICLGVQILIDDMPDEFAEGNAATLMSCRADPRYKGLKFSMSVTKKLRDGDSETRYRVVSILKNSKGSIGMFEGGGDDEETWKRSAEAIRDTLTKNILQTRTIFLQGGPPVPIREMAA